MEYPTIEITSEMMNEYFWPQFLHIVLPFVILIIVFGVIRIVCAVIFRSSRVVRILVDGVIVLLFLLAAGLTVPVVINTIKLPSIPPEISSGELYTSIYESVVSDVSDILAQSDVQGSEDSSQFDY